MKFSELTTSDLIKLAENYPKQLVKCRPDLVAKYNTGWMFAQFPQYTADHYPEWIMEHKPEWMAEYRPEYMWLCNKHGMLKHNPTYVAYKYPEQLLDLQQNLLITARPGWGERYIEMMDKMPEELAQKFEC